MHVNGDATISYRQPIVVLMNVSKVLEGSENKKEVISDLLYNVAPLTDDRCSYNAMIEFVTIRKLKGNLFRPVDKIDDCSNSNPYSQAHSSI